MPELIIALIGLILGGAANVYQTVVGEVGGHVASVIAKNIKSLTNQVNRNSALKEKLYEAYQHRNSNLGYALLRGSGFGPRADSVLSEMQKNKDLYIELNDKINKNANKLNQELVAENEAQTFGNSVTGVHAAHVRNAQSVARQKDAVKELDQLEADINQNVLGGAQLDVQKIQK